MYEFWKHALATAVDSEILAKETKLTKPEEAFTCGLLHDVGKVVFYQIAPTEFLQVVQQAEKEQSSFADMEKKLELPPHGYLGEYIANKWRLPMVIRMCIRYHHFDVRKMETILESMKAAVQIVRLANQIVVHEKIGNSGNYSTSLITPEYYEPLGINKEKLVDLIAKIHSEVDNASSFLLGAA